MPWAWVITIAILIIDTVISIWNSYAAGITSKASRRLGILFYVLGGLVPMTYVTSIVLSTLLVMFKVVSYTAVDLLLNFDFVVFGAAIIVWGVIATSTSIIVAVGARDWRAGLVSAYNIGALFYDTWDYLSNVGDAIANMVSNLTRDEDNLIVMLIALLAIALTIGLIITYAAYRAGRKRALQYRDSTIVNDPPHNPM
jgi:hypothetical protein